MTKKVITLNTITYKNKNIDNIRYKPIAKLGQGSYGLVVKCIDKQTNKIVAIKKLNDSYYQAPEIIREFNILNKLKNHINVISLLNIFRIKSFLYIVFPHMDYNMYEYITEYHPDGLGYDLTKSFMKQVRFIIIKRQKIKMMFLDNKRHRLYPWKSYNTQRYKTR